MLDTSEKNSVDKPRMIYINHPDPNNLNRVPLVGHGYLGVTAERLGCDIQVIDANFYLRPYNQRDIIKLIRDKRPHYVGITLFTHTAVYGYLLLHALKKDYDDCVYVAGGPHATILPEEVIRYGFDIACRGEGERVSEDLIGFLRGDKNLDDMGGISYQENGTIVHRPPSPFINDLDALPVINYDLFDPLYFSEQNLSSEFGVFTSRGCPNKCTFCNSYGVFGTRYRYRSAESILDELELLHKKYGVRNINFLDDFFTLNRRRLHAVCEGILKRGLNIRWQGYSMARPIPKDLLYTMKRAGCMQLAYGVENVYPKTIKLINKKVSVEQVEETFQNHLETGIKFKANIMSGFPWETKESLRANIDFILKKKCTGSNVRFNLPLLNPIPSTKIYTDAVDQYPKVRGMWLKMAGRNSTVSNLPKAIRLQYNCFDLKPEIMKEIRFLYFIGTVVPYYSRDALRRGHLLKRFVKISTYPFRKAICSYGLLKVVFHVLDKMFPKFIEKRIH